MLNIYNSWVEYEINFDGIKVFHTSNPTKFYRDIILQGKINIDNRNIKSDDVIYINELTKVSDFINLNKKSFLMKEIIDLLESHPIINQENINQISKLINNKYQDNLIDITSGDINKIISTFLEFVNDDYLSINTFKIALEQEFTNSKLFILDNVSWINLKILYPYLNEHKFIILTNDFRDYIKDCNEFELLVLVKENYDYTEIHDNERLWMYLEKEINENLDHSKIDTLLSNKNDINSLKMMSILQKI